MCSIHICMALDCSEVLRSCRQILQEKGAIGPPSSSPHLERAFLIRAMQGAEEGVGGGGGGGGVCPAL